MTVNVFKEKSEASDKKNILQFKIMAELSIGAILSSSVN
jgi:hypothetical protein